MEHVEVGGLRIAYERAGDGPPLVLLHGAFSDHRAWSRQIDDFSDAFTVVAWDAPGCGASSDPPQGATWALADYADVLAAFIAQVGLVHPHVLGLSFGAGLALELYGRHPALPRTLVLASAYAGWAGSLPPDEVAARLDGVLRDVERPPEEWIERYVPTFFAADVAPEVLDVTVEMMLDTRPAGLVQMARAFAAADLRDVLPRVSVPTLLLYGAADVRAPLPVADTLHAGIPTSELVVLSGVGHDSNLEAPDAFEAAVRRFLSEHGADRP